MELILHNHSEIQISALQIDETYSFITGGKNFQTQSISEQSITNVYKTFLPFLLCWHQSHLGDQSPLLLGDPATEGTQINRLTLHIQKIWRGMRLVARYGLMTSKKDGKTHSSR